MMSKGMDKKMKRVLQMFKKVAVTTVLSTCLIASMVTPAFAGVDANSLSNKIGNELVANFSITDAVDTVTLSWDEQAQDIALKSYSLAKDATQTVTYYVKPGADNDDDLKVSVLMKVPSVSDAMISSIQIAGSTISLAFTEGVYSYYVLKEELDVAVGAAAYSGTFDIAFNQANSLPLPVSLIAVKEGAPAGIKTAAPSSGAISPVTSYVVGQQADASISFTPANEMILTSGMTVVVKLNGIETLNAAGSLFNAGGTMISDLTSYWNAQTKTLTLPINAPMLGIYFISLKDAVFSSTPGSYEIKVSIDRDSAGTAYTISDEFSIPLTINNPG
jgi:hypothetical protein